MTEVAPRGTPERRQQDAAMIREPEEWPRWPQLPLKRSRDGFTELGVMFAVKEWLDTPTVFLGGMNEFRGETFTEAVAGHERKEYLDLDGLLDDGWTVD